MKHRSLYNLLVLTGVICLGMSALLSMWRGRLEANPIIDRAPVEASTRPPATARHPGQYGVIAEHNPAALKSLGLKLKGTVVTGCQGPNVAIIERFRTQEIYYEGDRVGQAQIRRVLRNKAIIRIGSRDELIRMEFEKNFTDTSIEKLPGRDRQQPAANTYPPIRLDRAEIVSSLEDLHQLMKEMRIHCYKEGEKPAGFLVSSIKPDSLFAKIGLRNGDMIMGVNKEPLASIQQAMDFYKTLVDGGDITLQIKRRGRPQTLRFEVQ